MWSDKVCRGAEAVLTSTGFKLVTGSIGAGRWTRVDHGESEKVAESLKLSKVERVHDRIFCGVQCTWQSADDKYRRRQSAIVVGHVRDYLGKRVRQL